MSSVPRVAHLALDRLISSQNVGTYGRLQGAGLSFWTAELPWRGNQRNVSCIPAGTYRCKLHKSPKHGWSLWILEVQNRSEILVHKANRPRELLGCVAIGYGLGYIGGELAVTSSGRAMAALVGALRPYDEIYLAVSLPPWFP
ncbi:MAG: DUF5675 family protein [Acidobacteriota bacterium]